MVEGYKSPEEADRDWKAARKRHTEQAKRAAEKQFREMGDAFEELRRSGVKPNCVVEESRFVKRWWQAGGRVKVGDRTPAWFLGKDHVSNDDTAYWVGYALGIDGRLFRCDPKISSRKSVSGTPIKLSRKTAPQFRVDVMELWAGFARDLAAGDNSGTEN